MTRVLVFAALVACTPKPVVKPVPVKNQMPAWFVGAWMLEHQTNDGGPPTLKHVVRDLQTPSTFASVRIDFARPAFPNAKSFDDLDDAGLAALLSQRGGFAGTTATFTDGIALWTHAIDFQPINSVDTARLEQLTPTTVLESGPDFTELWWSIGRGDGKYLAIVVENAGRIERMLVVVGDHFIYARNRAQDLPRGQGRLPELGAGKSRAELIAMLDCEFSYGTVRSGRVPWEIRYSTLPWREGAAFDPTPVRAAGKETVNTFAPDDLRIMFAAAK